MTRDHSIPFFLVIAAVGLVVALALRQAPDKQADAVPAVTVTTTKSSFQSICATCHGSRGEGNRELGAPTIASLPEWYLLEQLAKFRKGHRGGDPRDVRGQQMRAAILPLPDDTLEEAVAELLDLPAVTPTPTLQGDARQGALAFRHLCMECHRFNGQGELAFKSAPLAALPDWYLAAQIPKFLDGTRGSHPDDEAGAKMRKMATRPRNDKELTDILSHIATLATEFPIDK